MVAGAAGFLVLNWSPARIFMGDAGSTFLGFMFAGLAVVTGGTIESPLPLIAWAAALSPFLLDGSTTLAVRLWRRERLYRPHREHAYQLLVRGGWTHGRTTALYTLLAGAAGVLTLLHYCIRAITGGVYLTVLCLSVLVPLLAVRLHAAVREK
jgi:Fuc2NAc and GlcNAc transferase